MRPFNSSALSLLTLCCLPLGGGLFAKPVVPETAATSFPLGSVHLLEGPFAQAVRTNREYLLALDADRLLAPFLREAGLPPLKPSYGNWESGGLDGHTAGHYLSALALMVASGNDTPDGELKRRLGHMLDELERCQKASGDGYIGGVPGSKEFWARIAKGDVGQIWSKWVPWYNVHKTYAGLRDAYAVAGEERALGLLVGFGDWCVNLTSGLTDRQMQQMIGSEYGGMNETLADIYALTGDEKYLRAAERFNHRELLDPLLKHEDRLTGKHANTQIPKVVGFQRIATLTGDRATADAARFFWETVTGRRNVAFGGNSVGEHFNDPSDFRGMLEHREGPETCNTYNMLRLTEQLFAVAPEAGFADYYERALYNHILASIHPEQPGYVYFTPIRPGHYRVYSEPEHTFWCCVGTGMENPGKYGEFIYSRAKDSGVYVNLFIPSELSLAEGATLRQETQFPFEPRTRLTFELKRSSKFPLRLRHPGWVARGNFSVSINGRPYAEALDSEPSSYLEIDRRWRDGDVIEIGLPMRTTVERLPDGSNWAAILHGPIVLAAPQGDDRMFGLRADAARMGHVAHGPLVPLDQVPALLAADAEVPAHVVPDPVAGPLRFRLRDIVSPVAQRGVPLVPFFALHDSRYQMYWELTTAAEVEARREQIAASERSRAAREAATLDRVAVGEQQPEVEHDFQSEGARGGFHEGRRWREARWFQYTLDTRGEKRVELELTIWGSDTGRAFDVLVEGERIATVELKGEAPGRFVEKRFPVPAEVLAKAREGRVTVRLQAGDGATGHVFDFRLMRAAGGADGANVSGSASTAVSAGNEVLDQVRIGDATSESAHGFHGEGAEIGVHRGRHWRHGRAFEYTLETKGAPAAELAVVYWGGDAGRVFDILVDGRVVGSERLNAERNGEFVERRYRVPAEILAGAKDGRVKVGFRASQWVAGGIFDLRLVRSGPGAGTP